MSTPIDIQGILRVDTKQTDLTVAQYNGKARPGELVVDLTNYDLYVANLQGNLNPVQPQQVSPPNISNGNSGVNIPTANGVVAITVSGNSNVAVFGGTTITAAANLIPDADNVYSIGNATRQWKDLWVSGNTVYVGGVPISANSTSNTLSVAGNTVVTQSNTGVANANVLFSNSIITTNASVSGNLNASNVTVSGNLVSTGIANLGAIANVKVSGGGNGQVIVTDGTGNLSFKAFDTVGNATSNVTVPAANGSVNINVNANNIGTFDATGLLVVGNTIVSSNSTVAGNVNAGNFNTSGNTITGRLTVTGVTSLGSNANVLISGGAVGQALVSNGSGGLQWQSIAGGANGTYIANGTSSVGAPSAGGNIVVIANATTTVQMGKTLTTFLTDVQMANLQAANINGTGQNVVINANGVISTFDSFGNVTLGANLIVSRRSNLGPVGNVTITGGSAGQVLSTDGSGGLSWATAAISTLANGTSNITIPTSGGNIVFTSGGTAVANATPTGFNIPNVTAGALTVGGVSNLGPASNLRIAGGLINQVLTATGVGTVVWSNVTVTGVSRISNGSTSADIATFDGPLILQSSQGVVANISDQFYITGNTVATGNLIVQRNSFLGSNANVKITGGSASQVLVTDGTGNLTWVTLAGVGQPANIANGTTTVNAFSSNSSLVLTTGGSTIMTAVGSNINILAANTTYLGNLIVDPSVAVANLGNVGNLRLAGGTTGQVLTSGGSGLVSWSAVPVPAQISNGTSNVNIATSGGAVTVGVGGTPTVLTVNSGNISVTGNAVVSATVSSKIVQESAFALGASNAINALDGAVYTKTITAATVFTISNTATSGKVTSFILELTNGGAFGVTWWATIKWAGGTSPTLTQSGRDILGFYTIDGGSTWNGLLLGKDMK